VIFFLLLEIDCNQPILRLYHFVMPRTSGRLANKKPVNYKPIDDEKHNDSDDDTEMDSVDEEESKSTKPKKKKKEAPKPAKPISESEMDLIQEEIQAEALVPKALPRDIFTNADTKIGSDDLFRGMPDDVLLDQARSDSQQGYPTELGKSALPWKGGVASIKADIKAKAADARDVEIDYDPTVDVSRASTKTAKKKHIIKHGRKNVGYDYYVEFKESAALEKTYSSVQNLRNLGMPRDLRMQIHKDIRESMDDLHDKLFNKGDSDSFTALLQVLKDNKLKIVSECSYNIRFEEKKVANAPVSFPALLYHYILQNKIPPEPFNEKAKDEAIKSPSKFLWIVFEYHLKKLEQDERSTVALTPDELRKLKTNTKQWKKRDYKQLWVIWLEMLNEIIPCLGLSIPTEETNRQAAKRAFIDAFPTETDSYRAIRSIVRSEKKKDETPEDIIRRAALFNVRFALAKHRNAVKVYKAQQAQSRQNTAALDFSEASLMVAWRGMYDSPFFIDKALLVELVCGARMIEVLKVSDFYDPSVLGETEEKEGGEPAKNTSMAGHIVQHKIAKDRDTIEVVANKDGVDEIVNRKAKDMGDFDVIDNRQVSVRTLQPKPILFSLTVEYIRYLVYGVIRPELKKYLQTKKKNNKKYTAEEANDLVYGKATPASNKMLSGVMSQLAVKRTRAFFPGCVVKGTHTLRKIYANYSYDTLASKRMTRNAWIQQVLGHADGALYTSISYTGVVINRPLSIAPKEWENERAELVSSVAAVDARVDRVVKEKTVNFDYAIIDGQEIKKVKRTRGNIQLRYEALLKLYAELLEKNITPTFKILKTLGFGSTTIRMFRMYHKIEIAQMKKLYD